MSREEFIRMDESLVKLRLAELKQRLIELTDMVEAKGFYRVIEPHFGRVKDSFQKLDEEVHGGGGSGRIPKRGRKGYSGDPS